MNNFEFDGKKYKEFSNHQKEWGTKVINELNIKEDCNILDLGCGDGVLTYQLANVVPKGKVVGIDASKGMLEVANKLNKDNLEFKYMDIDKMEFDEKFDLIYSNAALHWVKDHKKLLINCKRFLNEKGMVRFNFAGYGNGEGLYSIIKQVMKMDKYKEYFKDFTWPWYMPSISEYEELIKEVDVFEIYEVYGEVADRYFKNEEELIGWIDQPCLVPFISVVPDEIKEEFRRIIIDKTLEKTKQNDGTFFINFNRVNLKAIAK